VEPLVSATDSIRIKKPRRSGAKFSVPLGLPICDHPTNPPRQYPVDCTGYGRPHLSRKTMRVTCTGRPTGGRRGGGACRPDTRCPPLGRERALGVDRRTHHSTRQAQHRLHPGQRAWVAVGSIRTVKRTGAPWASRHWRAQSERMNALPTAEREAKYQGEVTPKT
jgi:hypothetical protein